MVQAAKRPSCDLRDHLQHIAGCRGGDIVLQHGLYGI
jgi:hypothetical protein